MSTLKINVTDTIKNYEGKPMKAINQQGKATKEDITFRTVFTQALNGTARNETLTTEEKTKMYRITNKVYSTDIVNFSTTEAAFIVERVDKVYDSPLICGRVKELIDKK